jgi:hypothetical protein
MKVKIFIVIQMETTNLDVVRYAHKIMNRDKRLASPKENTFFWNEEGYPGLSSQEISDYNAFEKVTMIRSASVHLADYPFSMDYSQIMTHHEQAADEMRDALNHEHSEMFISAMVKQLQISFILVMIPVLTIYRHGLVL